ncbi:MAG: shikimate dehydrogenase [Candidatus Omnitrophica bacterium]|nr:shikimate dehydrogenase [Candidatus Omnitrophota bacterium]
MNPTKKVYGLIGYPLGHSLSPKMHNAAFKALGIDAEYKLFTLAPQYLDDFLTHLDNNGISGLNVTVPYKEKVLDFVELNQDLLYLRQVKAVNTMLFQDGVWWGFNTDIPGFSRHLKENFKPLMRKAAILGAGGAARAVTYVLAKEKASEIVLFDIDTAKSASIVEMVKSLFPMIKISAVDSIEKLDITRKDLLVNATPVGLKPTDPVLVGESMLHRDLFVYDLIYNPAETKLLALAKKVGARTSNGLGMLLYQGVLSFELWTGKKAPEELMRRVLLE